MAEKEVENIMEKTRKKLGFAPDDYKLKKMDKALGKFDEENKTIIINLEIIKFDKDVLEYVILHEFCHLKYKTHCKSFYKILYKNMKNYKLTEEKTKIWSF